ncbi:MAG: SymE family type I addiction module toxin [bacterium]
MRQERTLKVYNSLGRDSSLPLIRLQGQWVKNAGFQPGDFMKIQVKDGEILIKNMQQGELVEETHP